MTKQTNIMKQHEYADYKGVHKSRVTQWKKDGRLVFSADGKFVLVVESDERLKQTADMNGYANSLHAAAERAKINEKIAEEKSFDQLKDEVCENQLSLDGTDADILFKNARALKEKSAALQSAAEYEAYMGELVSKDVVEKIIFERSRQFRDGLISCKRRAAPELAGLSMIPEIEIILDKEFRLLLESFSKLPVIE